MALVFRFAAAHHGAGGRTRADRRHAGRDRRRPARARGLSRRGAACLICSRLDGVTAGYGDAVVLEDVSLALVAGGSAGAPRPQRRRQDDAAAHDHGVHPAARRQPVLLRRRHQRAAVAPAGARRPRLGAAGALGVPVADRRGAPHVGRAARPLERGARVTSCFRACTSAAATAATSCPAASSRCWPSAAR